MSQPAPAPRAKAAPQPSDSSRAIARQRRAALARDGRRAARGGDRTRTADTGKGTAAAPKPEKKGDCGCGCKGERAAGAEARPESRSATPAPRLGDRAAAASNGKSPRSKRADAALGAKPTGRMVALARRAALSGRGKGAANSPRSVASLARQANPKLSGRELAQKVRAQRSNNGSAGERKSQPCGRVRPSRSGAADQPWKVGVTETAQGQQITGTRVGRSVKTTGDEPSTCRSVTGTEYMGAEIFREFCQAEPTPSVAKVGVSPTGHGNRVTGNEVGRSTKVTGDEPGTCKSVTGTEYLSPSQYSAFCGVTPEPGPRKIGIDQTGGGLPVSGNMVGRSSKVTGDEPGTCANVTGTAYLSPSQYGSYCGTGAEGGRERMNAGARANRPAAGTAPAGAERVSGGGRGADFAPTGTRYTSPSEIGQPLTSAPPKVGMATTFAGGSVTGTLVGRSERVTGDEPGSCRQVTGDEYVDASQYRDFCQTKPQPEPPKVGHSTTLKGHVVSGTQTGRSGRVTGDEPGTCKSVTGTPYAGLEQAEAYCAPEQRQQIQARTRQLASTPGPRMTGLQPGIDPAGRGKMTGAAKGACEPLTGTPYIGADQYAAVCDGNGAAPGEGDFPQRLDGAPWQDFSVASPAREAFQNARQRGGVTGTSYESNRHITGPFGMADGKITGTEQFRFDKRQARADLLTMEVAPHQEGGSAEPQEAAMPRVTGEGQSAGTKVTGDDWERGDRVTGTEGSSARRRNPTRPGAMGAMPPVERKRNDEAPAPVSRVTGAAGSTDRGALITYSGGARG